MHELFVSHLSDRKDFLITSPSDVELNFGVPNVEQEAVLLWILAL